MEDNMNKIDVKETPRGPLDSTPRVEVILNGSVIEARREMGFLVVDVPVGDEDVTVRSRTSRDLRVRVMNAIRAASSGSAQTA